MVERLMPLGLNKVSTRIFGLNLGLIFVSYLEELGKKDPTCVLVHNLIS